jgi:hypothetical protein
MSTADAAAIRDFVAAHPGASSQAIIAGTGIAEQPVYKILENQTRRGLLIAQGERGAKTYRIGRAPINSTCLTPEERKERRAAAQSRSHKKRRALLRQRRQANAPKPSVRAQEAARAAPVQCQGLDDYLASGGQILRLPSQEQPYTKYPPIPDRFSRHL